MDDVHLLKAVRDCFRGEDEEVNCGGFEVEDRGAETSRKTRIRWVGVVVEESETTPIRRR